MYTKKSTAVYSSRLHANPNVSIRISRLALELRRIFSATDLARIRTSQSESAALPLNCGGYFRQLTLRESERLNPNRTPCP
ncbi:MAG: hypothetical protein SR1Q7_08595 [Quinella sp. 1Q7]|nr:hypothetical protein [Quinella sp. 1Q7]